MALQYICTKLLLWFTRNQAKFNAAACGWHYFSNSFQLALSWKALRGGSGAIFVLVMLLLLCLIILEPLCVVMLMEMGAYAACFGMEVCSNVLFSSFPCVVDFNEGCCSSAHQE